MKGYGSTEKDKHGYASSCVIARVQTKMFRLVMGDAKWPLRGSLKIGETQRDQ